MIKLPYNKPVQVSRATYFKMMVEAAELIAGREDNGKCYIKLLVPNARKIAEYLLNRTVKKSR